MFVLPDIRYFLISGRTSDLICRISGLQAGFYHEEQNTVEQMMRTPYNQTFFHNFFQHLENKSCWPAKYSAKFLTDIRYKPIFIFISCSSGPW